MIDLEPLRGLTHTIPVVVNLVAQPGDSLIVINGVAVGVLPPPRPKAASAKRPIPVSTPRLEGGEASPALNSDEAILAIVAEEPTDTRGIRMKMKISEKDPMWKLIKQRILRMKKSQVLVPSPDSEHKTHVKWTPGPVTARSQRAAPGAFGPAERPKAAKG